MTAHTVTPATELFERVSVGTKLFRIWWDIMALWENRRHHPLSTTQDLYPIVNRYYRPVAGSKSPPNPSYHLTKLKGLGLLGEFATGGSEGVLEPVTDKVVMVGGKVVYTPDMLTRMREFDVEALLKDGVGAPPVLTKMRVEQDPQPPAETAAPVAHHPCLVRPDEPVVIGPQMAAYVEAVMQAARERGYAPMSVSELFEIYPRVNSQTLDLPAITYRLEQAGFLQMVSGKKMVGNAMRVVVFQPYRIRHTRSRIGEEIVPPECAQHELAEPPVVETVEEEPAAQAPEPAEVVVDSTVESTVKPVTATGDMLAQVQAQLTRLEQAKKDAIELEHEEETLAQYRDQITKLERLVAELEISTTARRERLQAVLSTAR